MTDHQIVLLFMGPLLAALGGALIYFSGVLFDSWESRRSRRDAPAPGE